MRRGTWVIRNGRIVEKGGPFDHRPDVSRSSLPFPMVMSDAMDPVQSQLDGKLYDSKSLLRRTYREAGVVEVGNDPQRFKMKERPKPDRKAIRDSLERAKARLS